MTTPNRMVRISKRNLFSRFGLLIFPFVFLLLFSITLSLAPLIRSHGVINGLNWLHWIGFAVWLIGFAFVHTRLGKAVDLKENFILPLVALLSGWGLLMIFRLDPTLGLKQTIWLAVGILLIEIGLRIPNLLDFLRRYRYIWLGIGILVTALTLVIGTNPTGSGPRLWIGANNFFIQPSEPLKLLIIIFLAAFFSDSSSIKPKPSAYALPSVLIGLLAGAILFSQRDLGTAVIFFLIFSAILLSALQKKILLWLLPFALGVMGVLGYFFLDIVKTRIDIWLDPWSFASSTSYQVVQSLIAIASGGIMGTGIGLGSPGLVPVVVSDFIFAAISEEMGLIGSIILLVSLLFLSFQIFKIALNTDHLFHRYLAVGIASYFSLQSLLIIGGNMGVLPLTGVTLPLVSYGGSSLVTNLVCILIVFIIQNQSPANITVATTNPIIIKLTALFSAAFIVLILVNTWIAVIKREDLINQPENPRWVIYDRWIKRGDILDQNGNGLAITLGQSGSLSREVVHTPLSPVLGYTNPLYGQTNLEEAAYPYLRGLAGVDFSEIWWHQKLYNQPPEGLDIRISIDLSQQDFADGLLGATAGSIVLMNASTGEIYVMASHPYFDANTLDENWDNLINDPAAPLLNRATQGTYSLGSASALLLMPAFETNSIMELSDLSYSRRMDLSCLNYARDYDSLAKGIQFGCERAISQLIEATNPEQLISVIESLGLYSQSALPLQIGVSPIKPDALVDVSAYLYGKDGLLVSPLQMAGVSATLTNGGKLPQPRLLSSFQNRAGDWVAFPGGTEPAQTMDAQIARKIQLTLQASNEPYWFSLGQVTNQDGTIHTWFMGGTMPDWIGTPLALSIILEEDNPAKALSIGQALLTRSIAE